MWLFLKNSSNNKAYDNSKQLSKCTQGCKLIITSTKKLYTLSMISPFILLKREGNRKHHHHHDNMVMLPLLWTSVGMYAMHHYQTPKPNPIQPSSSLAFSGFSSSSAFELSCCSLLILISNLMCVVIPLLHTRALCSWTIIETLH